MKNKKRRRKQCNHQIAPLRKDGSLLNSMRNSYEKDKDKTIQCLVKFDAAFYEALEKTSESSQSPVPSIIKVHGLRVELDLRVHILDVKASFICLIKRAGGWMLQHLLDLKSIFL